MALRKIVSLLALASLLVIAGSDSGFAQEGKFDPRIVAERQKRAVPISEPGSRALEIKKAGPTQPNSAAKPATPAALEPPKYKTSGREFYALFPSIIGSEDEKNPSKRSLYISSRGRTKVTVRFLHRPWSATITTVPNQVNVVEIPAWGVLRQTQFENIFDLGIKIEAEDDITVYGYSHEGLSSDGWMILPTEALGQHYVVASQRNSLNYSGDWMDAFQPRSNMTIMAVENETLISFRLSAVSQSGALLKDSVYSIRLNEGEVFPIMARDTGLTTTEPYTYKDIDGNYVTVYYRMYYAPAPKADCDLTGSEVWSDKPIVVVSGHERATTPDTNEFNMQRILHDADLGISRDHLTEQMPPVELWGNEFFVMASTNDLFRTRGESSDMVRILSATDNNVVEINGVAVTSLNAREYYQFSSGAITHIKTSQPSLVVKYMKSMARKAAENRGDPDMTVVQPIQNLATAVTIPIVNNGLVFHESYLNILVHNEGYQSLRINGKKPQTPRREIPGTDWSYYVEYGEPGEWRVECDLPCYAEAYAYGYADSYTFPGGGDFKYQDSLFGDVLDYQTLLIGRSKTLTGHVSTGADFNLLTDSVTVFGLTWMDTYADTAYFRMLDTITTPIKLGPNGQIPIRFAFSPDEVREYRARAWVHSSSRAIAYIDLVGYGALMSVDIIPKEINFGRIRVDTDTARNYSVIFSGEDAGADVTLLARGFGELATNELGFTVPPIARSQHKGGSAYTSSVTFRPMTEGWRDTGFSVYALLPHKLQDTQKLHVRLIGRGVMPNVETESLDFGDVRIERFSQFKEIEIRNIGSDTTHIVSIELDADDPDWNDFTLDATTIPAPDIFLDTLGVEQAKYRFRARFNPDDTGHKEIRVRIRTLEQTIYATLTGRGVEPYIVAIPPVLDFGVIDATLPGVDLSPTKQFVIKNDGTYEGIVYRLSQTEVGKENFVYRPLTAPHNFVDDTVAIDGNIDVEVTFNATRVGEFIDTIFVSNDTRNQPFVILKGLVRTGLVVTPEIAEFDTVRDCDPVELVVRIENPNTVGIEIDTIYFEGDTAGFTFGDVFIEDLIRIEGGSYFDLKIRYVFPEDRLSGEQTAKVIFYQNIGDDLIRREILLHVYRDIKTLSLITVKPSYTPSAGDGMPFRLPIWITGEHEGLTELDNFDMVLRFSNDLFMPVGIDRTGSLTEGPGPLVPVYDPVARTYTISGRDLQVSKRDGDLLFTVLMRAVLTLDSTATVTPELELLERPCAYVVAKQGVELEYAEDCGDYLLRDQLRKESALKIVSVRPDPLVTNSSTGISFDYIAAFDSEIRADVVNTSGAVVWEMPALVSTAGNGTIQVPASVLPSSGNYVLRITQRPTADPSSIGNIYSRTFRVLK